MKEGQPQGTGTPNSSSQRPEEQGVSRRGFLKKAALVGGVAVASFVAGRATSGEPTEVSGYDDNFTTPELKSFLTESLSDGEILRVRKVINDHFKPPFQELQSFSDVRADIPIIAPSNAPRKTTLPYIYERKLKKGEKSGLRTVNWEIKGENGLNLTCWVDLEADGKISRFHLVTDLTKTFESGLTPDTDQYIDTTSGRPKIAAKDLEPVFKEVFRVPEDLEFRNATTSEYSSSSEYDREYLGTAKEKGKIRAYGEREDGYIYRIFGHGAANLTITSNSHTPRSDLGTTRKF